MPRLTFFQWTEACIGKIQAITPKAGEARRGPITAEEHMRKALGFDDAAQKKDTRPVLVYFHYPHDSARWGKLMTSICSRTLDDEQAARWSKMFRCVQLDMGATEKKYAEMIGSRGEPRFVALDQDMKVKAEIPLAKSGSKVKKALEAAFKKLPAATKKLKKDIANHKKWMAEAKRLEKKKEFEEAVEVIDQIRFGNVRVSPYFEKAVMYGQVLAQKAERAAAEK